MDGFGGMFLVLLQNTAIYKYIELTLKNPNNCNIYIESKRSVVLLLRSLIMPDGTEKQNVLFRPTNYKEIIFDYVTTLYKMMIDVVKFFCYNSEHNMNSNFNAIICSKVLRSIHKEYFDIVDTDYKRQNFIDSIIEKMSQYNSIVSDKIFKNVKDRMIYTGQLEFTNKLSELDITQIGKKSDKNSNENSSDLDHEDNISELSE
jgi:hypothetical protein